MARAASARRGSMVGFIPLMLSASVAGQPLPAMDAKDAAAETRSSARRHFEQGVELINQKGDAAAALAEFRESLRLLPTFASALNAAVCLKELGRYAEALAGVDALLGSWPQLGPAQRASVDALRSQLLDRVGELSVSVDQLGSSVVVDSVQRGTTPLAAPLTLDIGVHMLRVSKDGFQTIEQQVLVTPRKRRAVELRLQTLVGVGTLAIAEKSGGAFDVLIDGALVGRTPFRGSVAAGPHSIQLRGDGAGTAPSSVDIRAQRTSEVTLLAVKLDAEAFVDPNPPGASVYIDGVFAGNGSWTGPLPAGPHRFEVMAPGYAPFRTEMHVPAGRRSHVRAGLIAELPKRELLGFYVEPSVGLVLGRSLRGATDDACDCGERSRPFGFVASARFGYRLRQPLAIELTAGYLRISESSERGVALGSDPGTNGARVEQLHDVTRLAGPFALLGIVGRWFEHTPLTTRLGVGLSLLWADNENSGTARATLSDSAERASGALSIDEPTQRLLAPMLSSEVRIGRQLGRHLSADIGVAVALFVPPSLSRSDRRGVAAGPDSHALGLLSLPDEPLTRPFLAVIPSIAGRFNF